MDVLAERLAAGRASKRRAPAAKPRHSKEKPAWKPAGRTTYAVWEITLKCNLACKHCGSRAGEGRVDELSTEEAFDLVRQMAEVGVKEVTMIGGEAFMRRDWLDICEEITKHDMRCSMTTGGFGITREMARRMKDAGMSHVSVSIDGLEATHDGLRGRPGSFRFALDAFAHFDSVGLRYGSNAQLNRLSLVELPLLYETLIDHGVGAWQLAMTVPMGEAADNNHILLQPNELLVLHPVLGYLAKRGRDEGLVLMAGNNVGYYGPYERLIRSHGQDAEWRFWTGCTAGLNVLGIEADGAIKGCPSLPTQAYVGARIRDMPLAEIIATKEELTFNMTAGAAQATDHMWGFCKSCDFAPLCRGGCSWTSHVFFDKRGNNPYCHHRAMVQRERGVRERFRLAEKAPGVPFDNGVFELSEEAFDAPYPIDDPHGVTAADVRFPDRWNMDWEAMMAALDAPRAAQPPVLGGANLG